MKKQILALAALVMFYQAGISQDTLPPNILLIVADDLGYEKLGCYGGIGVHTPNLDRLAASGVRFERAYTSPVCTPSRMSIYTGQYAHRHGYTEVLPVHKGTREAVDFKQFTSYAQLLRAQGYHTAVTGKWQLATLEYHPDHCKQAGFESWCVWQIWKDGAKTKRYWNATYNQDGAIVPVDSATFGPDLMAQYVIDEMTKATAKGQPFCIQHNMVLPHVPIIDTPDDRANGTDPSLDSMITYLDQITGELMAAVERLGIAENTYIIFVGDNGTQSQTPRSTRAGLVHGGKWDLNEGGMHVPLLIAGPGLSDSTTNAALVDMTDLFPTICALAGVPLPSQLTMDGRSLHPVLNGQQEQQRSWVTGAIKDDFAIFDGQWRLHHKGERLVDCRNLPEEKEADLSEAAAQEAFNSLSPVLRSQRLNLRNP
jgi:arylsulfatase A